MSDVSAHSANLMDERLPGKARVAEPRQSATREHLRECPDCGQIQSVPPLLPGSRARCQRCNRTLRRGRRDPLGRALALSLAGLGMLGISLAMTLMTVSTFGMFLSADLFSGPQGLARHGLWELSLIVLAVTVAAPLLRLAGAIYVLGGLRISRPPPYLARVFAWSERLRPWAMLDVFLLGVFVAYVKLAALVHIDVGVALYALGGAMLAMVAADAMLDRQAVWEEIERLGLTAMSGAGTAALTTAWPDAVGCDTCALVCLPAPGDRPLCPRCGFRLERRKPNSIARAWALTTAAAILYIPANVYPVLTVVQLGSGEPSTILGGARELLNAGMWPLAALVFVASIAIPCLKLVGLTIMLVTTQLGKIGRLKDRTLLYRIVSTIGRWSMIDVFMESLLVALVQFGSVVTIDPGIGAVAFAAVVILTMLAAEAFDPRLMWDAVNGPAAALA